MASKEKFQWPWQYNFPPFFTIQPNLETKSSQIDAWCSLVLDYHKHLRKYQMDVAETSNSSPLFKNDSINRKLTPEAIQTILDTLEERGNLEWADKKKKDSGLIMWRTPDEWGNLIWKWAMANGFTNTVCTLYEIHSGDDSKQQDFCGMEMWLLKRAIISLQAKGKAAYIAGLAADDSDSGVKFFA